MSGSRKTPIRIQEFLPEGENNAVNALDLGTPIIDLKGITFKYPGGPPVLDALDFTLGRGDRVGIIAPNGSGKSTLFHIIMGLLKPVSGRITLFGKEARQEKDFAEVRRRIGLLFQDADDQLFSPTVLEDVAFGPLNLGKTKTEAVAVALRTLASLGLQGFEERITFEAPRRRETPGVAVAGGDGAEVLLLDEPGNGLDTRTRARLMEILPGLGSPTF